MCAITQQRHLILPSLTEQNKAQQVLKRSQSESEVKGSPDQRGALTSHARTLQVSSLHEYIPADTRGNLTFKYAVIKISWRLVLHLEAASCLDASVCAASPLREPWHLASRGRHFSMQDFFLA